MSPRRASRTSAGRRDLREAFGEHWRFWAQLPADVAAVLFLGPPEGDVEDKMLAVVARPEVPAGRLHWLRLHVRGCLPRRVRQPLRLARRAADALHRLSAGGDVDGCVAGDGAESEAMSRSTMHSTVTPLPSVMCRLCGGRLDDGADTERRLCSSCLKRPEARRLGRPTSGLPARAFTAADQALIRRLHGYMPAGELLRILNDRLLADLGPDVSPYTLEQLHVVTRALSDDAGGAADWAGLRRLLADARRTGLLAAITTAVIDDFAAVYQLTPAQVTRLKDVIAHAREDR